MTEPQRYRYDVFISYSQDDREWVWGWLLPRLEAAGLSVCLDESCFEPGAPRAEETERVVRESRRSLVVLSPALVASQWDQFEALLVHAQDPAASGRRLIPLLLKPCDPPERIKLLQWVDFSDPERQEAQLRRVIDAIQGKTTLPELRPEAAFPSPKQRREELRWFAVAGVAAVLTLALLAWWVFVRQAEPTMMPEGSFNIAVAEFALAEPHGDSVPDDLGKTQASSAARYLAEEKDTLQQIKQEDVEVWGPGDHRIPPLTSEQAAKRTEELNANILIYGDLAQVSEEEWKLEPKLYFRELIRPDDRVTSYAAELYGDHALGKKIVFDPTLRGDVNRELRVRLEALNHIIQGMIYFSKGDTANYQRAIGAFEQAATSEWAQAKEGTGQEILYLFLGNAYFKYAMFLGEDDVATRLDLWAKGKDAFEKAIDLNPDYARAYNGLGDALFQLASPPSTENNACSWDWRLLDQAYSMYQKALSSSFQPAAGDVELRANLGLGRVRFHQYCLYPEQWNSEHPWIEAEDHYRFVLKQFDVAPGDQRRLPTAIAATDFASMYFSEAVDFYSKDPGATVQENLEDAMSLFGYAVEVLRPLNSAEVQTLVNDINLSLDQAQCLKNKLGDARALEQCKIDSR